MDPKWNVYLYVLTHVYYFLVGARAQNNTNIDDYYRVRCGWYDLNPFHYFCLDGRAIPCDTSHCNERLSEQSRIGCALFCEQVLQKLKQLPKEIAAQKLLQNESALTRKQVNKSHAQIVMLKAEKLKLENRLTELTKTDSDKNEKITEYQEQIVRLKKWRWALILCSVISVLATVFIIGGIVYYKLCVNRRQKTLEEESLISSSKHKKEEKETSFSSCSKGTDSTSEFSTPDADKSSKWEHKCDDFNKIPPTNNGGKSLLVPSEVKAKHGFQTQPDLQPPNQHPIDGDTSGLDLSSPTAPSAPGRTSGLDLSSPTAPSAPGVTSGLDLSSPTAPSAPGGTSGLDLSSPTATLAPGVTSGLDLSSPTALSAPGGTSDLDLPSPSAPPADYGISGLDPTL